MAIVVAYGLFITGNNICRHRLLHEKLINAMKLPLIAKQKKKVDKKKDKVLLLGKKQLEKLAKKGIMIQLVKV